MIKRLLICLAPFLVVYAALSDGASGAIGADITLTWTPSPGALQHNVYRIFGGATNTVASLAAPISTLTITNVATGTYTFYVKAVNGWGESSASNLVSTPDNVPPAPSDLKMTITISVH